MLSKLTRSALDLIFPIHCTGCEREGGILCEQCANGLKRVVPPFCRVCAAPGVDGVCRWCLQNPRGFEFLHSPYRFEGPIRDAIHALKYRSVKAAADSLGDLMAEHLQDNPVSADVLVPVPLHPRRLRSRGYNQSALLAKAIGKRLNLPVNEDLLIRAGDAQPQVEVKSREERLNNVAGNFLCAADAGSFTPLLVDDVATTASTLSECAHVLSKAGAARVYALTLARDA